MNFYRISLSFYVVVIQVVMASLGEVSKSSMIPALQKFPSRTLLRSDEDANFVHGPDDDDSDDEHKGDEGHGHKQAEPDDADFIHGPDDDDNDEYDDDKHDAIHDGDAGAKHDEATNSLPIQENLNASITEAWAPRLVGVLVGLVLISVAAMFYYRRLATQKPHKPENSDQVDTTCGIEELEMAGSTADGGRMRTSGNVKGSFGAGSLN